MNPLLLQVLIAGGIFIAGLGTGSTVQSWRLEAKYANKISDCNDKYNELKLSLERQNSAIVLTSYQLEVSKEATRVAEESAKFVKGQLANQTQKAKDITATTCNAMVESLKGVR